MAFENRPEEEQRGYGFSAGYGNMAKMSNTPAYNAGYAEGKKEAIADMGLKAWQESSKPHYS